MVWQSGLHHFEDTSIVSFCMLTPITQSSHLHEAAKSEDCEVEAAVLQEGLCAALDCHEGHLWVPVAVVDGEEDIPRDPHGLHLPGSKPMTCSSCSLVSTNTAQGRFSTNLCNSRDGHLCPSMHLCDHWENACRLPSDASEEWQLNMGKQGSMSITELAVYEPAVLLCGYYPTVVAAQRGELL